MLESDPIPSPQQLQAIIDETIDEVFEEEEDIVTEMGPKATPTPETVVERFENKFRSGRERSRSKMPMRSLNLIVMN